MSAPPLPGVLGDLAPVLDHWGYWAVGGLIFVEDFGVPAPGETILIAAALYAGAGQLNILAVIAIGIIAAILGDNVGYLIGRTGGHALIARYGKYILLTPERYEKAEMFFTRHGGKVVTIARFVEGLRQANGIIAGTAEMPWRRFLAFNTLGAALWVGLWAGLGYTAGNHITTIYTQVNRYSTYLLAALGLLLVALIARTVLRRRKAGRR
ncbi:DedA family protein [Streptomyces sp. TRM68367]|uniref:DedA family protein n=1 Tax=Streptomyces sp. TRM68367 TaxID=2758415 RepID=UPI00165B3170|nr:DedA family protein [Streptomyces sp. TRM68367]MBC9727508.1 DedA family protein [Streptomyces sp. TRM68367]